MNIINVKECEKNYKKELEENVKRIIDEYYLDYEERFQQCINSDIEGSILDGDKWETLYVTSIISRANFYKIIDDEVKSYNEREVIEKEIASKIFEDIKKQLNVYKIRKDVFLVRINNNFFNILITPLMIMLKKLSNIGY